MIVVTLQAHVDDYASSMFARYKVLLGSFHPIDIVGKAAIMSLNERLELTIRKALRDSAILPANTITVTYDPPHDPELRDAYDEIFQLATQELRTEQHAQ